MMEENETISPPRSSSLESNDFFPSSGFEVGSKLVHRFYFVKHWPREPDSISQIKKIESVVEKMNQDIHEITAERIEEKMSERNHVDSRLKCLNYWQKEWRSRMARKGKILDNLYWALDELCFVNFAPKKRYNKACFTGELDNHMLNSFMLHGSKSLAEEKQILRDINIQQRDVASFKSLEELKKTIRWNYYLNNWQKLLREIEKFQIQQERVAAGDASLMGKNSNYESLKKAIKDEIKHFCDESLENRRTLIAHGTKIRRALKELDAIDQVIYSLRTKLAERNQKKGQAYQSILKLKILYYGEVMHYYQYCSLVSKIHQLAKEKDIAALDELSCLEVGNFMLGWNNSKAFREDYEKKVLQSLERRKLSRDGRRRLDKSCSAMLL